LAQLPWLGLLLLILLPRPAGIAIGLTVAVLGIALGSQLRRWERQLLQGDGRPPRNRD
jgi:xanthosine utilization system XapX-like protein